ncbi:MAG: dihydroorotate dehydrogenase electron transfer subunit [Planctomycetota bacterium]
MNTPLHASHYADAALQRTVEIVENVSVAEETHRIRFRCPEIARLVVPGQFLMARIAACNDPLIGRALAVYDIGADHSSRSATVDLVYQVKGKFTTRLRTSPPGTRLVVWGPLGNGFPLLHCERLIMVAGGIGQTPFLTLAKEHLGLRPFGTPPRRVDTSPRITLCFGARSKGFLAGVEDFQQLGVDVRLATEDGSAGHQGRVTDLLWELLAANRPNTQVTCCGPVPMMRQAARISADFRVPCYVSLETPMACGIGICFCCVAKILDESGHWDYKRTCVEGPVFDANRVAWE